MRSIAQSTTFSGVWTPSPSPATNGGLATSAKRTFVYLRNDDRFEQVEAYWAEDTLHSYLAGLGLDDVNAEQQDLIVDTIPDDNSFYSPGADTITLGRGGVDDATGGGLIGDVASLEGGHAAGFGDPPDGLLAPGRVDVRDQDARALAGEGQGGRPADAGACARDQNRLALEAVHARPRLMRSMEAACRPRSPLGSDGITRTVEKGPTGLN